MFDSTLGRAKNRQTVSAALNVAMLEQQVVTFASSAKASAFMDIQVSYIGNPKPHLITLSGFLGCMKNYVCL